MAMKALAMILGVGMGLVSTAGAALMFDAYNGGCSVDVILTDGHTTLGWDLLFEATAVELSEPSYIAVSNGGIWTNPSTDTK